MARSTIDALPPAILAAVHDAIERRETIDAIVARIRDMGGDASRSHQGLCRTGEAAARHA
jgi:hypothetical protein